MTLIHQHSPTSARSEAAEQKVCFKGVEKIYPSMDQKRSDTLALDALDLDLAPGEIVSIIGPTGCGKSTALNILAGFEQASKGSVSVDGQAIIRAGSLDVLEARIAPATFFIFDLDNTFMQRVEASEAFLKDGYWLATKAKVIIPGNEPEMHDTFQISSNLSRQQIKQSYASADSIPFWSLPDYIRTTEMAGLDTTRYKQQYQTLMARPILFVAMVLIAASVSLRFFRFGGVARMVLAGVAAGFTLYIATKLIEDLGGAGILSTTAAAWLPSLIGGLLGTLALLYQEDG